ncbi:MAG TPA: hypothetical protein VKB54_18520 [Solirubrobacteraceae bacterium]|jgi:hypothetical protein|nr:hypothetical protein [Solirubrobacteraceae bacterium]
MRSVLLVLATAIVGVGALSAVASAAEPPPGAAISDSLEYVGRVPDSANIVEGKFDRVRGRDVLVTTGRYGFRTYDVSDPTQPKLLGSFQPPEVLGPNGYWQDEDMDLDVKRNLIIGALDPRHDDVDQASCPGIGTLGAKNRNPKCRSGFYVISYDDPEHLRQVGDFVELPAGHTTSCVDDCKYVWTGGPARRDDLAGLGPFTPGGRGDGRPIWVTDLRDAKRPKVFSNPIDLGRNDGLTDYSHDVDVDDDGFAWISGRGGLTGYATAGKWRDPKTDTVRRARPWDPVLVAGGGLPGGDAGVAQPQTDFIHNSARPLNGKVHAAGVPEGNVALMTEEDFTEPCNQGGRIVAADITSSLGGEGATGSTPEQPFRMTALDSFHPARNAGDTSAPITSCSAHYFEVSGSTLAAGWYGEGLRLIDASDARNLRQVGYYYVTGTDPAANPSSLSWDTAWRGDLVYLFDMARGIEVLRLKGGPARSARLATVREPARRADRLAAVPVRGSTNNGGALVCPLFTNPS